MQRDSIHAFRKRRLKRGFSQEALAKQLGVSQSTVSRRERQKVSKYSKAGHKVEKFMETGRNNGGRRPSLRAAKRSLDIVWKKCGSHATTLSKIIGVFGDLCETESE